ncbi:MAG: glycerate kinase [Kiritimatiellae bacterium]|nr:glycerate kinase [Kiritimatiellia bacterium]
MKIVLAFDSFKGSLPADLACHLAAQTLTELNPKLDCIEMPMADGGEGTAAALIAAHDGEWIPHPATGPLPSMIVDAGFGWLPKSKTAIVEMAAASGLTLLRPDQRNPCETTTLGTGELIRAAVEYGAQRILLALGGSATVDGGIGAAHALGWRFLDSEKRELAPIGANLSAIATLTPPPAPLALPEIIILADVTNPLCGTRGAAHIFGPQKGATPEQVDHLDAGLQRLANAIQQTLHRDIRDLPGSGAAGGLAAGAIAFMNATLQSGIDTIIRETHLEEALSGADWILTGEGSFDRQSLHGKVVSGIAALARKHGVACAVLAGRVELTPAEVREAGIAYAAPITPTHYTLDEAIRLAPELLARATAQFWEAAVSP